MNKHKHLENFQITADSPVFIGLTTTSITLDVTGIDLFVVPTAVDVGSGLAVTSGTNIINTKRKTTKKKSLSKKNISRLRKNVSKK